MAITVFSRPTWPRLRSIPAGLLLAGLLGGAGGCASQPEAPRIAQANSLALAETAQRLAALLPLDVLLLGEQHDAAEHQAIEAQVVSDLAARGLLAAVALEMADAGASTAALKPSATELQVRSALRWDEAGWPWASYGPAVMAAVKAGIPVMGANLPRIDMRASMQDSKLDAQLPGPALKAQQQLIRIGHCDLLPESQITPMTRIQIAKDVTMANTLAQAVVPGKTVLLLSGSGHSDRFLGVPQHLPRPLKVKAVRLLAGNSDQPGEFDAVWRTSALPDTDYCAGLRQQFAPKGGAPAKP